jgi:hypothetical protein
MIYKQSVSSSPLVDKILSEISEGSQHIRDREIYTTGKVLRGDKSQLTRSTGAGALTSSAAKELGPKAVELRNKKAISVSLPNLSDVKEESLVDKILSEMIGDKPGCDTKKSKPLDKIAKKHKVSVESLEKQLKKGTKIEMEHTTDRGEAETIALHHLEEIPDYYSRLVKMEGEAEVKEAKKYMTKEEDPCWKGYEMVGFKKKGGKKVPNCVPVNEQQSNQAVVNALQNQTKELEARKRATQSRIIALKQQKNTGATGEISDISTLGEATTRLPMQTGQLLRVLVNWRGKHISVQMFFPQLGTPKRDEITYAVNKIYPESRVISYVPCSMDSSAPIVQVKEEKEGGDSSKKPLNKPMRTPGERKKFKVYVRNSQGNIVTVRFGDPNMEIKRDDPDRLAAFRARHNCADAKDKTTPKYWSCYQWRAGKKVED